MCGGVKVVGGVSVFGDIYHTGECGFLPRALRRSVRYLIWSAVLTKLRSTLRGTARYVVYVPSPASRTMIQQKVIRRDTPELQSLRVPCITHPDFWSTLDYSCIVGVGFGAHALVICVVRTLNSTPRNCALTLLSPRLPRWPPTSHPRLHSGYR